MVKCKFSCVVSVAKRNCTRRDDTQRDLYMFTVQRGVAPVRHPCKENQQTNKHILEFYEGADYYSIAACTGIVLHARVEGGGWGGG